MHPTVINVFRVFWPYFYVVMKIYEDPSYEIKYLDAITNMRTLNSLDYELEDHKSAKNGI